MPAPLRHYFQFDEVGDVTVIRFTVRSIRTDEMIQNIFSEVNRLVDEGGRSRIVLDFSSVQDFASLTIGKLIALNKKLKPPAGRLALCQLTPSISEILSIMGLERFFNLYPTQEEALRSF